MMDGERLARLERATWELCEVLNAERAQGKALDAAPPTTRRLSSGAPLKVQVDAYEKAIVVEVLALRSGNVTHAAKELGMTREGLHKVIRRHAIG
jgi:transcriptional regulator of acetoin/glycerol metabolism